MSDVKQQSVYSGFTFVNCGFSFSFTFLGHNEQIYKYVRKCEKHELNDDLGYFCQ